MNPSYVGQPMPTPSKRPAQSAGVSAKITLILIGLVVAVLAGVGLMIANRDDSGVLTERLVLRLDALEDIVKDGKKNASSDKMKKLTSELSLLLIGDKAAIEAVAPKVKKSKTAAETENSKLSIERLKSAKINANYDSAYASELTAKLESTTALIDELMSETRSKSLKQALTTTDEHLQQVLKDLAN